MVHVAVKGFDPLLNISPLGDLNPHRPAEVPSVIPPLPPDPEQDTFSETPPKKKGWDGFRRVCNAKKRGFMASQQELHRSMLCDTIYKTLSFSKFAEKL